MLQCLRDKVISCKGTARATGRRWVVRDHYGNDVYLTDERWEHIFNYDEASDTLYVSFFPGEQGTGIELNDHILLRIDKKGRRAIGITFRGGNHAHNVSSN